MTLYDFLKRLHRLVAISASLLVGFVLFASCIYGINYYYGIRWYQPDMLKMFEFLNDKIPPDKALLSNYPYIVDQFPGLKAASYRPEVAWYLDREIAVADNIKDIEEKVKTGKYPYYLLMLYSQETVQNLYPQLRERYNIIASYPYIPEVDKKVPWSNVVRQFSFQMAAHVIFDLNAKPGQ